ncbi:MAG: hypothetical protein OHK0046_05010 [Anaerolineae bacterium]
MGIRLDWDIEADQRHMRGMGEDPDAARTRRAARFRLLLVVGVVLILLGSAVAFVLLRAEQVDMQLENLLTNTVSAEVTALRIGDWNAFSEFQRSASPDWTAQQRQLFDDYQTLLLRNENAQLTGRVVDLSIDDPRGRVLIEEIVDGVPYNRTWFYWRFEPEYDANGDIVFEGGWRHVPPDYTFWGEPGLIDGERVQVSFLEIDRPVADVMAQRLDEWIGVGCAALNCASLPELRVSIRPNIPDGIYWSQQDPWLLQVRSPYATRARADLPFSPEMQIETASLLAERMTLYASNNTAATPGTDAQYIQSAVASWLVGRFVLIDTGAFLVSSLASSHGEQAVGQLLAALQPSADIGALSQVTGATLDQSNLDWRDFFTWRLRLENQLITLQDQARYLTLYAPSEAIQNVALARFSVPIQGEPTVTLVQPTTPAEDGTPQVQATVRITQGDVVTEQQVLFRLVNNVWLRAG